MVSKLAFAYTLIIVINIFLAVWFLGGVEF